MSLVAGIVDDPIAPDVKIVARAVALAGAAYHQSKAIAALEQIWAPAAKKR